MFAGRGSGNFGHVNWICEFVEELFASMNETFGFSVSVVCCHVTFDEKCGGIEETAEGEVR